MADSGRDSGRESNLTSTTDAEEYQPRNPHAWIPSATAVENVSNPPSGYGTRASSGSKSSGQFRRDGRASGPGSHDPDADFHPPVTVDDSDPWPSNTAGHNIDQIPESQDRGSGDYPPQDSNEIIGLAHHRRTGYTFYLSSTETGLSVTRIPKDETDYPYLTFKVSQIHEGYGGNSTSQETSPEEAKISLVGDYVVLYMENCRQTVHSLDGLRLGGTETDETLIDISGFDIILYSLLKGGRVARNMIYPNPRQFTMATVYGMEQACGIATCHDTGRVAIVDHNATINIYENLDQMSLISSFSLPGPCESLCLRADELIAILRFHRGRKCYIAYIQYSYSVASVVWIKLPYKCAGRVNLCILDADQVLCTFDDCIRRLDLREIRGRGSVVRPHEDTGIFTVSWDVSRLVTNVSMRLRGHKSEYHVINVCINVHKITGELLLMSRTGEMRVFHVRDIALPQVLYKLPLPDDVYLISRFDTTDEGDVIAISRCGVLLIFSNRQLRWHEHLGRAIWDAVCSNSKIYVLVDDSIIVYNDTVQGTGWSKTLSLGLEDHVPMDSRLAVHGDVLYMLVPWKKQVLRMDMREPVPSFITFIDVAHSWIQCLTVTEDGDVLVGGVWQDRAGVWHDGLRLYSPTAEFIRTVRTVVSPADIASCSGGRTFILAATGRLHYIQSLS